MESFDAPNPQSNPACVAVPPDAISSTIGLTQNVNSELWLVLDPVILIVMLIVLRTLVYIFLRKRTAGV